MIKEKFSSMKEKEFSRKVKAAKMQRYSNKDFVEQQYSRRYDRSVDKLKDVIEQAYVKKFVKGNVLDCGAGTGRFTMTIKREGYDVIAADSSEAMLSCIRKKNGSIPLILSDIEYLPFRDHSFDSIVSMRVLFHLPHYKKILKEYMRVLRPEGRLLFEMQSGEHFETCRTMANRLCLHNFFQDTDPLDYSNWICRSDITKLVSMLGGKLYLCNSYDMFTTYWFSKIKVLSWAVQRLLRYNAAVKFFSLVESKVISHIPAFFSARFFIVVEKN